MLSLISSQVSIVLNSKVNKGKYVFKEIGLFASSLQKKLLGSKSHKPNGPFAVRIKGKNTPLEETKRLLLPSISYRLVNDKNKIGKQGRADLKIADANYVDELIKKINRK